MMKLLFDQNLSPRLADFFAGTFVGSKHLQELNLEEASDSLVWEFAKNEGFTMVWKKRTNKPVIGGAI